MAAIMQAAAMPAAISNVVPFRPRLSEAHRALLAAWVKAGRRMGLHDAEIVHRTPEGATDPAGMAVIWVRENPDPAYLVRFEGVGWAVVDSAAPRGAGPVRGLRAGAGVHSPGARRDLSHNDARGAAMTRARGRMRAVPNPSVKIAAWLSLAGCVGRDRHRRRPPACSTERRRSGAASWRWRQFRSHRACGIAPFAPQSRRHHRRERASGGSAASGPGRRRVTASDDRPLARQRARRGAGEARPGAGGLHRAHAHAARTHAGDPVGAVAQSIERRAEGAAAGRGSRRGRSVAGVRTR